MKSEGVNCVSGKRRTVYTEDLGKRGVGKQAQCVCSTEPGARTKREVGGEAGAV